MAVRGARGQREESRAGERGRPGALDAERLEVTRDGRHEILSSARLIRECERVWVDLVRRGEDLRARVGERREGQRTGRGEARRAGRCASIAVRCKMSRARWTARGRLQGL